MAQRRQRMMDQVKSCMPTGRWMTSHEVLYYFGQKYPKYAPNSREMSQVLQRMPEVDTRKVGLNGSREFRLKNRHHNRTL